MDTFTFDEFGFTIAKPRFFDSLPLLSTNITAFVVKPGGRTPAWGVPASPPRRQAKVSNTTRPVPLVVDGVTTAYPDWTGVRSSWSSLSCGPLPDGRPSARATAADNRTTVMIPNTLCINLLRPGTL